MQCIEVVFDSGLWRAGFGSGWGANGKDCSTVIPDKDGYSLWCFEWYGAGWARVDSRDGTIIQQDALFGSPGYNSLDLRENGSVALWVQDSHGFYYTSCNGVIYKFTIPSPRGTYTPDGTLLNGYANVVATYDYHSLTRYVEDWAMSEISGTTYLAATATYYTTTSAARGYVFNGTTMTLAGTYMGEGDNLSTANTVVTDKNGIFWMSCNLTPTHGNPSNAPPNNIDAQLVKMDMTSGSLVHSLQVVPAAVHGLSYTPYFLCYVPASNALLMAPFDGHSTDGVAVISMDTWTQLSIHPDDLKFFMTLEADSAENSFDVGVQNGKLMVEGSVVLPGQSGGLLQIIDPTTLAVQHTIDCVALMTSAGVPDQAQATNFSNVQNGFVTSFSSDGTTATATLSLNYITVPPATSLFFQLLTGATWFNNRSFTPLTSSGTTITFTDTTGHGAFGPSTENPPYSLAGEGAHAIPPLSTFGWQQPAGRVGACFLFVGSPLYIFQTATPPPPQLPEAAFSLQKLILSLGQDTVLPVRGRNR